MWPYYRIVINQGSNIGQQVVFSMSEQRNIAAVSSLRENYCDHFSDHGVVYTAL